MMSQYPVNDCYTCIQGEGVQTGVAMVLLRLHGCAVGCPWCDTKETWDFEPSNQTQTIAASLGANPRYVYLSAEEIVHHITTNHPGPQWVLITGGEPAIYDLKPLVSALHKQNYRVALETSGTEVGHLQANVDWICVSPKINMPGGKRIKPEAIATAHEIKHVIGRQADIEQLDTLLAQNTVSSTVQICLQPVSTSPKATKLCIETVQARGWRLSIQTHKLIGIK